MSKYYIYTTTENDRWDKIATKFYGNCYNISPIIEANPHVMIDEILESGIQLLIPISEEN